MKEIRQTFSEDDFKSRINSSGGDTSSETNDSSSAFTNKAGAPTFEPLITKRKKPPLWLILLATLIVVSVASLEYFVLFKRSNSLVLNFMASTADKSCPVMIDAETRLDHVTALAENTLQYTYTLVNREEGQIDSLQAQKLLVPNIINMAHTSAQMKFMRDKKVTLAYIYNDRLGKYLFRITLTPDLYVD